MATLKSFDPYFQNFPQISQPDNFNEFWKKSLAEMKKIPIEPEVRRNKRKDSSKFQAYEVYYNGFLKTRMHGILYTPVNIKKSSVIIHIHDYNSTFPRGLTKVLPDKFSHFLLILRGHSMLTPHNEEESEQEVNKTPGYMVENILDLETYYLKSVYLDVLKSIDMLRLVKTIDCGKIGIIGKGLGAAAAFFTAAFNERIAALVCESPQLCNIPMSQNISTSQITEEINDIIAIQKQRKDMIKSNLNYCDLNNFALGIKCPAYFITGLNDHISPSECTMGLFNLITSEKTIEVYPDGDNSCGSGPQAGKSMQWLARTIEKSL